MSKKFIIAFIVAFAVTGGVALGQLWFAHPTIVSGSVSQGSEYHSTSTPALFVNNSVLQTGPGALGSVVITNPGTGSITLYDGTTTLSHPDWATTTIATFGASAPAGTYTFDAIVQKGLLVQFGAGTIASTTITYR